MTLFLQGKPTSAHTHHTQALAIYTPQAHRPLVVREGIDLGVSCHDWLALERWQLGYPDQAVQHSQEAMMLAQDLSYLNSAVVRPL